MATGARTIWSQGVRSQEAEGAECAQIASLFMFDPEPQPTEMMTPYLALTFLLSLTPSQACPDTNLS